MVEGSHNHNLKVENANFQLTFKFYSIALEVFVMCIQLLFVIIYILMKDWLIGSYVILHCTITNGANTNGALSTCDDMQKHTCQHNFT